jgi:V8-like Glu-specific endopeptidase
VRKRIVFARIDPDSTPSADFKSKRRALKMPQKARIPKPIRYSTIVKRRRVRPKGKADNAMVSVVDISLKGVAGTQVIQKGGRLRVVAEVGVDGFRNRRRDDKIPVDRITKKDIGRKLASLPKKGACPGGVPTAFVPKRAKRTHTLRPEKGKDVDRGGTIFGTDDRYLFDDQSFPWRTTGKVRTVGKWGSGTTIGPRHVLTASHVMNWTGGSGGGVAWVTFTPGYFDGSGPWGEIAATRVIYWLQAPGSLTDQQTAFDYAVLIMEDRIGDWIGYPGYRTYDDDWNGGSYWQYVGYPQERSSGERPAYQGDGVISSVESESISGQTGYVLGHFNEFTPGQSGGAVWGWWGNEPWPRVVGVGSTIGSTAVQTPTGSTTGDNEYGGGPALSDLISYARSNYP